MKRQFPGLRGLAIILVVLNHAITISLEKSLAAGFPDAQGWVNITLIVLRSLGFVAVPIFLFISGGFFGYVAQGTPPGISYRVVWNNLKIIFWPYFFWSVVFYLYVGLTQGFSGSPVEYIKHLLVGYPYNFIPLIMFFYVLAPLIVRLVNRIGWLPVLLLFAIYQTLLILVVFPASHPINMPDWMDYIAPPVLATTLADWGIYFPLGLIYSTNSQKMDPLLRKFAWLTLLIAAASYGLTILHGVRLVDIAWIRHILPLAFVLLIPLIERKMLPQVKFLEEIGKHAYGIYLQHLLVIDGLLLVIGALLPAARAQVIILAALGLLAGLLVPRWIMNLFSKLHQRRLYRLLYG